MREHLLTLACLGLAFSCAGCSSAPRLTEYPAFVDFPDSRPDRIPYIPVILVGTIAGRPSYLGDIRASRWDSGRPPLQLVRVTVQVETILQSHGEIPKGEVPIYFFIRSGSYSGPPRLGDWNVGDRMMFFLQQENGYLRTICDHYKGCTMEVFSGAHRGFRAGKIGDAIIDLLLTRGEGAGDEQMIRAINISSRAADLDPAYAMRKLRKLAAEETPAVAKAACQKLQLELNAICVPVPWNRGPWAVACNERLKTDTLCPAP